MVVRALACAAFCLAVAVAGCNDPSPTRAGTEAGDALPGAAAIEVETSDTRGGIRGVVVDLAIRPVAGALVELRSAGVNQTTGEDGAFGFDLVDPGTHFLHVSAPRYFVVQSSADVRPGEATLVRILLQPDPELQPYRQTWNFHGYHDLYAGPLSLLTQTVTGCVCEWLMAPDGRPVTFVVEGDGTTTMPPPPAIYQSVYWEYMASESPKENGGHAGYAEFPFTAHVPREDFSNETVEYRVALTGGAWVSGRMDFDVFVTVFYVDPAPEGWSFLAGDA